MSNSRLFTAEDVAKRNEYAEAIHLQRQAEICRRLFPDQNVLIQPIAGGIAIRTLQSFSWKLNRVEGLGMNGQVLLEKDLCHLESTFANLGLYPQIHICPLSNPSVLQVLALCGYTVAGFVNFYVRWLNESPELGIENYGKLNSRVSNFVISKVNTADQIATFIRTSIAGFRDNGRSPELLRVLAQIASLREDTHLYFATVGNEVVGTAALAVMNTPHGDVAHLYLDSTVPEYRGQGVHAALVEARLLDAKRLNLDFASLATAPGSSTARNAEKAGFLLAYTKAVFTKQFTS